MQNRRKHGFLARVYNLKEVNNNSLTYALSNYVPDWLPLKPEPAVKYLEIHDILANCDLIYMRTRIEISVPQKIGSVSKLALEINLVKPEPKQSKIKNISGYNGSN